MDFVLSPPSDIWSFRHANDGWRWRCTSIDGDTVIESLNAFETMEECAKDAARRGYVETVEAPVHGLVGSRSSRVAEVAGGGHHTKLTIERDGVDDDEVEPDYPDGETP